MSIRNKILKEILQHFNTCLISKGTFNVYLDDKEWARQGCLFSHIINGKLNLAVLLFPVVSPSSLLVWYVSNFSQVKLRPAFSFSFFFNGVQLNIKVICQTVCGFGVSCQSSQTSPIANTDVLTRRWWSRRLWIWSRRPTQEMGEIFSSSSRTNVYAKHRPQRFHLQSVSTKNNSYYERLFTQNSHRLYYPSYEPYPGFHHIQGLHEYSHPWIHDKFQYPGLWPLYPILFDVYSLEHRLQPFLNQRKNESLWLNLGLDANGMVLILLPGTLIATDYATIGCLLRLNLR